MLSNKIDWMVAFYFVLKEPAFKRDDILVLVTCNTQSIVFYKLVLDDEVSITPMNCLECCGKWCRMIAITILPHQLILTECNTSACLSVCGYEIGIVHTQLFPKKRMKLHERMPELKGWNVCIFAAPLYYDVVYKISLAHHVSHTLHVCLCVCICIFFSCCAYI